MSDVSTFLKSTYDLASSIVFYNLDEVTLLGKDSYHKLLMGLKPDGYGDILVPNIDSASPKEVVLTASLEGDYPVTYFALKNKQSLYDYLLTTYPLEKFRIDRLIRPISQRAIDSTKGNQILYHDASLIEPQESRLLSKIQDYICRFRHTWNNSPYIYGDVYYLSTHLSGVYAHMVHQILKFRLEEVQTAQGHSFHRINYLLSHGLSGIEVDKLSIHQQLALQDGLRYTTKNIGTVASLDRVLHALTDNTPITVHYYRLVTKAEEGLSLDIDTRDLLTSESVDGLSFEEFLYRSDGLDRHENRYPLATAKGSNTKILLVSNTGQDPLISLFIMTLANVGRWVMERRYIKDIHLSSSDTLSVSNAFQYLLILLKKQRGSTSTILPCNLYLPVYQESNGVALHENPAYVSAVERAGGNTTSLLILSDRIASSIPEEIDVANVTTSLLRIYDGYIAAYTYIATLGNYRLRTVLRRILLDVFPRAEIALQSGAAEIDTWLELHNLSLPETTNQVESLARELIVSITGINHLFGESSSVVSAVLRRLSSYSTKVIDDAVYTTQVKSGEVLPLSRLEEY